MELVVPARVIAEAAAARAQELAVRAFVATECEGMARVDMFVRSDGEVLVNELNTIPGFTAHERLREALRGERHRRTPSCSSGWSTSRSSATSGAQLAPLLTGAPTSSSWIVNATQKPSVVTDPDELAAVLVGLAASSCPASIVRIAPAANESTNATTSAEAFWKSP